MKKKLAIITTHPIQYNAPFFKELASSELIDIKVFYTWGEDSIKKYDPGFGKNIAWDIPLLEGYNYSFVKNISRKPGSHHFFGIKNPTLIKEVKNWNANAILIYGWSFESHLKAMVYFKGKIPVFFRGDSTLLDNKKNLKSTLRKYSLHFIYKFIDTAFYVGTNNKNYYLRHGLRDNQLCFVPHCIDNHRFDSLIYSDDAIEWRRNLGINDSDIVILYAGKLEKVKNPGILFTAFTKIVKPGIHLVVVGNGPLEQELKDSYQSYSNIHFIGFQNQSKMPLVYRIGDIFILPSYSETWGLSINEAMACNLPVIVSNKVGCAIDLVEIGKNGFIFKSNDLDDLIGKLTSMISMDLKEMGRYSKSSIQNWSVQKAATMLIHNLTNIKIKK